MAKKFESLRRKMAPERAQRNALKAEKMSKEAEFEAARAMIQDYLMGTMRRKTEELEGIETDKEKRKIKFILKFLQTELDGIVRMKFEDVQQ